MEKVKITIAGENYNISTDDEPEYLLKLAEQTDEKIMELVQSNGRISVTQAAVLTCLEYADKYTKSEQTCENLRSQIQDYLEEAAKSRSEAEIARRENAHLTKQLDALKSTRK